MVGKKKTSGPVPIALGLEFCADTNEFSYLRIEVVYTRNPNLKLFYVRTNVFCGDGWRRETVAGTERC